MDRLSRAMIKAVHAVFDREPQAEPAFRVRAPGGLTMTVADGVLTLARPDGSHAYALDTLTLAALVDRIEADGYAVPWQSQSGTSVGAHTLVDVAQEQDDSDTLRAYTNPLWAHMDALGAGVGAARDQIAPMLRQIVLPHAEGEWADLFGQIFGVPRRVGESDADYTRHIIDEVGRARSSPSAILANIRRMTGAALALREPWKELFALSESALSGEDYLQGAPIWQYHTMQLVAREAPDWAAVLVEADADRPAGTILLPPATHPWPTHLGDALGAVVLRVSRTDATASTVPWFAWGQLSENLALSDVAPPVLNEQTARIHVRAMRTVGLRGPYLSGPDGTAGWLGTWDGRPWVSDPPALEMSPPKTIVPDDTPEVNSDGLES
ncbi:MAG: hypothetical protein EOM91_16865 [Sphingobacteriia bacterium]|nr:hypothetical protein [Sphingobacteriia bacterium]